MKKSLTQPNQDSLPMQNRSYILRLWRVEQAGVTNWRASLENPRSGERFGFTCLEQLFAFLIELTEKR